MTIPESKPGGFDKVQFGKDIEAAKKTAATIGAKLDAEWAGYEQDPQSALVALGASIRRVSDLFVITQQETPSPARSVVDLLVSPEEKLESELGRFERLSKIVSAAGITNLPHGHKEAAELLAATIEMYDALDDEDDVIIIPPEERQIPAGRALQAALRDSSPPEGE
jgi:hypothetical protein